MANPRQTIIVKRVKKAKHSFHGGSWKVAFADFAVAMMAFFLVLWLSETATKEQKMYISGYFEDPGGAVIGPGGADAAVIQMVAPKATMQPAIPNTDTPPVDEPPEIENIEELAARKELQRLEDLRDQIVNMIGNTSLALNSEQIQVDIVAEGIRVQIFDKENRPMFSAGSAKLEDFAVKILNELSKLIIQVPNKVSLTGHTDGIPYEGRDNYTNWELSADRANAARRQLVKAGLPLTQIAKVEGLADSVLLDKENPANPTNRRIDIIILKKSALEEFQKNSLQTNLEDFADKENNKLKNE